MSTAERACIVQLADRSAHSSYFTVKLDGLGKLVRYWHKTWKHASKKDMILIVANKFFDDIPPCIDDYGDQQIF